MQTRHPCSRNYVHCIFVLLFVGSPISIDCISTTTPLPCQIDLAKGKNITKDPRYGKSEVYPAVWLKCKFALAQAQGESKDPSHTSGSITCPLCPTLFLLHCPKFLKKGNPENVRSCSGQRGLWCKRADPCSRNYALCIFVYLFVGSPKIIDSLALVPLFYATRFSKWRAKTRGTNRMEVISPHSPLATGNYSHVWFMCTWFYEPTTNKRLCSSPLLETHLKTSYLTLDPI